ncbi:hypothetical protein BON30_31585 [Cystobacter ferrugineus]|uniref:Lipoprotein n=1 Tax=Cystobacter ferrugineus TaxID=83449 RepID=A0A1L9B469_9BACT|nr:hypothetical protein BON30_31585 [Cystobacter ferrugineus]
MDTRRPLRAGALALAALMLVTACATGTPMSGGLTALAFRYHPPVPRDSPEPWAQKSEAEDWSQGEAFFAELPTDFAPVQVSDAAFLEAMTTLWLNMPLRVAVSRPPLYVGRRLALASAPLSGETWQSDLARSYGQFCERCRTPGDCLTLFEDGPRFQDDDKRNLALALKEWHHIVEQTPGNAKRFGGKALHNTENVIALDKALHDKVSAFYSRIRPIITRSTRLTVRQWLGTQSYEAQREFGLLAMENIRKGIWR